MVANPQAAKWLGAGVERHCSHCLTRFIDSPYGQQLMRKYQADYEKSKETPPQENE